MQKTNNLPRYLCFAVLALFLLQIGLLPAFFGVTYATRSQKPEHTVTFADGALKWDGETAVLPSGAARLNLFDTVYPNVSAEAAEKVLAPGTENDSTVRFVNRAGEAVRYTAVLYSLKSDERLAAQASLWGDGFSDTENYSLPPQIEHDAVVRAVCGELGAGQMQEFTVDWSWRFDGRDAQSDAIDTALGDLAAQGAADTCSFGFYLVMEQNGIPIPPTPPKTGDSALLWLYLCCLCISGGVLLALCLGSRKRRRAQ